jgi:hypothetical protein
MKSWTSEINDKIFFYKNVQFDENIIFKFIAQKLKINVIFFAFEINCNYETKELW